MSAEVKNDNVYKVGTFITAKEAPEVKLVIASYQQRIYYCEVVGKPEKKQLVYFERELIPFNPLTTPNLFNRVIQQVEMVKLPRRE